MKEAVMHRAYCSLCGAEVPVNSEGRCPSGHTVQVPAPAADLEVDLAGAGAIPPARAPQAARPASADPAATEHSEPEPWVSPVEPLGGPATPTPPVTAVPTDVPPPPTDPGFGGDFGLDDLQEAVAEIAVDEPVLPATAYPPTGGDTSAAGLADVAAAAAEIAARGTAELHDDLADFDVAAPAEPPTVPDPPADVPPAASDPPAPTPAPVVPTPAPAAPTPAPDPGFDTGLFDDPAPPPAPPAGDPPAPPPPPVSTPPAAPIDPYNFTARGSKPGPAAAKDDGDDDDKKKKFRLRR